MYFYKTPNPGIKGIDMSGETDVGNRNTIR